MRLANKIYSKKTLAVLDFGSQAVSVIIAEKNTSGHFHVLGAGEAPARGVEQGNIVHLGDAVESVVEALSKAQNAAGIRVQALYYNFDDIGVSSASPRSAQVLSGEGEVRPSDIDRARLSAERLVGDFEKTIIYSKPVSFIIDDHDRVSDPRGVFARKLEVQMHILQVRSAYLELWQRMIERAHVDKSTPVLSALSTVLGILPKEDRQRKRFIIDLGKDICSLIIFQRGAITDLSVCLAGAGKNHITAMAAELSEKHRDAEEFFVTGELAQDQSWLKSLGEAAGRQPSIGTALGVPGLTAPRYASIAGLMHAAEELGRGAVPSGPNRGLWESAKQGAQSFLSEYF